MMINWEDKITKKEAYAMLIRFLEKQYEVSKSDLVLMYADGLRIIGDDMAVDQALWEEFIESLKEAESGKVNIYLRLK